MTKHISLGCTKQSDKLRKLILENPDLSIMVEVETELCLDDTYTSWIAPSINFRIGEVLDCDQHINDERIYFDRQEFEDDLYDWLENDYYAEGETPDGDRDEPTEEEVDRKAKEVLAEYEPYWKKAIIIHAGT